MSFFLCVRGFSFWLAVKAASQYSCGLVILSYFRKKRYVTLSRKIPREFVLQRFVLNFFRDASHIDRKARSGLSTAFLHDFLHKHENLFITNKELVRFCLFLSHIRFTSSAKNNR